MMKTTSVKKNFAYQMIYEILILLLPFITSPYIARVLGAEGVGIYSYSYSIAYYFVLFSMLGLKNYGNRAIARVRDDADNVNRVFSEILVGHVIVSFVCILAYVIYIFSLHTNRIYAVVQLAYVVSGLFDISWFYFGIEQFKTTVIRSSVIKIINVILILLLVKEATDLWIYCLIMSGGALVSQLVLWIPLKKYVKIVKPSRVGISRHFKPMIVLFISAIAVSLYKYMDKIMISLLSSNIQLGFYENAEKAINMPNTVIGAFGTVMLPKMSYLAERADVNRSKQYIKISMNYVMCLAIAMAFGAAGIAKIFAPLFWGSEFESSGKLIMGLAITIPFMSFANILRTQYLIPNEKDKEYLSSIIFGAIVNILINALLIPAMGAMGAAVGTVAAEISVCVVQTFVLRHELDISLYVINSLPFLLFGVVMFSCVYYIGLIKSTSVVTLLIQLIVGVFIYGVLCVIYFVIKRDKIFIGMIKKVCKKI